MKAFIGLYEDRNIIKGRFPEMMPTRRDIDEVRRFGCYFPPSDRLVTTGGLDPENDGFPAFAAFAYINNRTKPVEEDIRDYIDLMWVKRLKRLPGGFKTVGHKAYYQLLIWCPQIEGGSFISKEFLGFDNKGNPHLATHGNVLAYERAAIECFQLRASTTIQFYQDRRYLWNVAAQEGAAKAQFGVYEEQVKSLFYARQLPMTDTGRKRPILHWVRAHRRRLKAGTDISIEKFLRGVTKFEMNGTVFEITRPTKQLPGESA